MDIKKNYFKLIAPNYFILFCYFSNSQKWVILSNFYSLSGYFRTWKYKILEILDTDLNKNMFISYEAVTGD